MRKRTDKGRLYRLFRLLWKSPPSKLGLILLISIVITAVFAPWLAPYDPNKQDLRKTLIPPGSDHAFGTDRFGRDVLSRVIYGSRLAIGIGVTAVVIGAVGGTIIGLLSGFVGGWWDFFLQRIVDVMLAFRLLLLSILIVSILGTSIANTAIAIGISVMASFARLARGEVLAIKNRDFVEAAKALGASKFSVVCTHIIPHMLGSLLVFGSLRMGDAILAEAALSFIGLGPPPPSPSWGLMVKDGLAQIVTAPWVSMFPGIAITLLVLGLNLVGDGLRDTLDPRLRGMARMPA